MVWKKNGYGLLPFDLQLKIDREHMMKLTLLVSAMNCCAYGAYVNNVYESGRAVTNAMA